MEFNESEGRLGVVQWQRTNMRSVLYTHQLQSKVGACDKSESVDRECKGVEGKSRRQVVKPFSHSSLVGLAAEPDELYSIRDQSS